MRIVTLYFVVAMFLLTGCDKGPDMGPSDNPELDVVVSLLAQQYGEYVKDKAPLVVVDTFTLEGLGTSQDPNDGLRQRLLSQAQSSVLAPLGPVSDCNSHDANAGAVWRTVEVFPKSEITAELVNDFCDKNAKPGPVWPELQRRGLRVVLISDRELGSLLVSNNLLKRDTWDVFYAKYPKSPGFITISRVGFSKDGTMAMVYLGYHDQPLASGGQIYVFRKKDGKWVEVPVMLTPMWMS